MEITTGKIIDYLQDGTVLVKVPLPNLDRAILRQYEDVEVGFSDGRHISPDQRKKAFAILGEIAEWSMGYRDSSTVETVKEQLKLEFITHRQQALAVKMFSLSDTDCTTAREFINYLIDFCIEWEIPTKEPLMKYCEDIQRFVYQCLLHKKCAVCGRSAFLHHMDGSRIGMGNNRQKVNHIGRDALPLCAKHHDDIHRQGERDFLTKYHLEPVKIDEKIARIYKLSRKGKNEWSE